MIKFNTKLDLTNYIAKTAPREANYTVVTDETLQGKKAVYEYRNGTLLLLSENINIFNWRTSVATFADIAGITSPLGLDAVVVLVDETHSGQPTQYYYNGYSWVYNGIYFKEALELAVSDRNTRGVDITAATDYTLPLKYVVGSGHLHIYYDDIILVAGVDFTEVGTNATVSNKIQFTNSIANQARLIFKRVISNKFDETVTARRGKVDVYYFDTFTDAMNSPMLIDASQIFYTFGNTSKGDGGGRYWILNTTDIDGTALKNKANTLFINKHNSTSESFMVSNITSNTVTGFLIPKNKPIGYKVKVRKAHAGTAVITIAPEDTLEKITRAALASVTLTSDGDYWELEKVTATRWDLIAGQETISATHGNMCLKYDGVAEFISISQGYSTGDTSVHYFTYNFPRNFAVIQLVSPSYASDTNQPYYANLATDTLSTSLVIIKITKLQSSGSPGIWVRAIGRWYV